MVLKYLRIFSILLTLLIDVSLCERKIVCYYGNWIQNRSNQQKILPENIDPHLCTHIIYGYTRIDNNNKALSPRHYNLNKQKKIGMYNNILNLKAANPNLKILLSLKDWNYTSTARHLNNNLISTFVLNVVKFLKRNQFDGLDLNWEYAKIQKHFRANDKYLFTILVTELKKAFKPLNLLLTATLSIEKMAIDKAYEVDKISKELDWINLIGYGLNKPSTSLNSHSPLFTNNGQLSVNDGVKYWLSSGASVNKLVLVVSTYGRKYKTQTLNKQKKHSRTIQDRKTLVKQGDDQAYFDICKLLSIGWTRIWDNYARTPYAFYGNEWITYDDVQSVMSKINFIKSLGLGGIGFKYLNTDDWSGNCGQGKFPLINLAKNEINTDDFVFVLLPSPSNFPENKKAISINEHATTTTKTTTKIKTKTTTTTTTTKILKTKLNTLSNMLKGIKKTKINSFTKVTQKLTTFLATNTTAITRKSNEIVKQNHKIGNTINLCSQGDGYYADYESNCSKYYVCIYSNTPLQQVSQFTCPANLKFNTKINVCDWAHKITCIRQSI